MGFTRSLNKSILKPFKKNVLRPTTKFLAPVVTGLRNDIIQLEETTQDVIDHAGKGANNLIDSLTNPYLLYILIGVGAIVLIKTLKK